MWCLCSAFRRPSRSHVPHSKLARGGDLVPSGGDGPNAGLPVAAVLPARQAGELDSDFGVLLLLFFLFSQPQKKSTYPQNKGFLFFNQPPQKYHQHNANLNF